MRARRRHPGFTLIETIAAIVILAVALPPMMWAVRDAHVQRVDTLLASRARWLAVERLEDVIADRHGTTRGWAHVVGSSYPSESPVATEPQFERSISIVETDADLVSAGTGYKTVTVAVSWTSGAGAARTLEISTVLTEYAP